MIRNSIYRGIQTLVRAIRGDDRWEWRAQYEREDGRTELVLPTFEYEEFDTPDDALDGGQHLVNQKIDEDFT